MKEMRKNSKGPHGAPILGVKANIASTQISVHPASRAGNYVWLAMDILSFKRRTIGPIL